MTSSSLSDIPPTVADRKQVRVLLVDDHVVTRLGLRTLLSGFAQLQIVGEAGSVATAFTEAQRCTPDVILLDVRLPDGNGFDVCRSLESHGIHSGVLILTSYADDETVFQCIAAGADGYLLKEIDPEGLVRAIETVAEGKSVLDPSITRQVLSRVRLDGIPSERGNCLDILSAQERRVLALVAQGKTNKEIAAEMKLSDKTVKNYLSNTLDKLKVSRRSQAAALFVQHT